MASLLAKLWTKFSTRKVPVSIMIVGLDNSGKSSILSYLASFNHGQLETRTSERTVNRVSVNSSNDQMSSEKKSDSKLFQEDNQTINSSKALCNEDTLSSGDARILSKDRLALDREVSTGLKTDRNNPNKKGSTNILPTVGYNYERVQYKNVTITVLDFSGQNRYRNLWQEFYNSVDAIVFVVDSSDLIRFVVARDELETLLSHPYFSTLTQNASYNLSAESRILPNDRQQKQITISQGKLIQAPLEFNYGSSSGNATRLKKKFNKSPTTGAQTDQRVRVKVPILFLANKTDLPNSMDTEVIVKALNLNQLPFSRHPWLIQATSVKLNQGISEAFDWLVSQLSSAE